MNRPLNRARIVLSVLLLLGVSPVIGRTLAQTSSDAERPASIAAPQTAAEARGRARLLHEMVHGSLQVMHRDFFDEDNPHAIPSASLEDVFVEMSRSFGVELKWLNAGTDVVNIDHQPEDEFEKHSATQLAAGEPFVESITTERYRFAGPIRLKSECLKCHVKRRSSNRDRTAGLLISMPLRSQPAANSGSER